LEQAAAKRQENQVAPLMGGNLSAIEQKIKAQDEVLAWCDRNSEGGEIGEGDKTQYVDAESVKAWRRDAESKRQELVVDKKEELFYLKQAREKSNSDAYQLWPDMFDRSKPEFQQAVAILRQYPFLQAIPEANMIIGTYLEGQKKLQEKITAKNGQPQKQHRDIDERVFTTPRVPIAPHSPEPLSRESRPSPQKQLNEAMSRLTRDVDGSAESLTNVFAAMESAQKTRAGSRSPVKS
jgi:hypothetical protein